MAKIKAKKPKTRRAPIKKGERFRTEAWMESFLAGLKNSNCVGMACKIAGIARSTAYERRRNDPVFAEAWNDAKDMSVEEVETTIRERALKGVREDVWYQGKVVGQRVVYDHTLILAWVNANNPEKWRPGYDIGKAIDKIARGKTAGEAAG